MAHGSLSFQDDTRLARFLIIAGLITALLLWWHWTHTPDPKARRRLIRNFLIWGLVAVIVVLAASGRIHWLGAAFAGLFLALKYIGLLLVRFFPALAQIYMKKRDGGGPNREATATPMTTKEAREILGVGENADKTEIRRAHRHLMQKLHPDHGGNAYLASRLNEARDLLLRSKSD